MVYRTALLLTLFLLFLVTPAWSQDQGRTISEEEIRQYEARLREMVNRFEEARELLREEIAENEALREENAELQRELRQIREERERLEGMSDDQRIAELRREVDSAERLNDALVRKLKATLAEGDRLEALLKKAQADREAVRDDLLTRLDLREEQKLFQIGTGFSPQGYINGLVLFNIPRTALGLFGETNYRFREREWSYSVGVQLRFGSLTGLLGLFAEEPAQPGEPEEPAQPGEQN